jgi:6-phosphogluconate dehydrogenase
MAQADVGLVGLAVMGQNLALNLADHGHRVVVQNRTTATMEEFVVERVGELPVTGAETLADLVDQLDQPRRIILMVKAGDVVDAVLDELVPLLDAGDVVIDGGNSNFSDTRRREAELGEVGVLFQGTGISGGEEGARNGPSIMPGGPREAWELTGGMLRDIAADADDGEPCCDWLGEDGAGHFVKMVHNGIEYGDMQLIAEAYDLLHRVAGLDHDAIGAVFSRWNEGPLASYLVEITADIMVERDDEGLVLERILDAAGQKGTGRWTAVNALHEGAALTLVTEAVFARTVSSQWEQRQRAAEVLGAPDPSGAVQLDDVDAFVDAVEQALHAAKIVSYAQGFQLLRVAAETYGWSLDLAVVARLWRAGCIIRSAFLDDIAAAYTTDPELEQLLLAPFFADALASADAALREVVVTAVRAGVPAPALSSAIAFHDGSRTPRLPANLIQAQRDYFGAHTYERVDGPRGEHEHHDWIGSGGAVSSGSYDA